MSAAQTPPASDVPRPPAEGRTEAGAAIALVLPLGSETFGRAASAVRAGFLAAAAAANAKPVVIGHGDDVDAAEDVERAQRRIAQISDRCGDHI